MTIYKEIIVDAITGKETKIKFTDEEFIAWQKQQEENQIRIEQEANERAAKEAARQSALEKLAALGLTEAEIQALAG